MHGWTGHVYRNRINLQALGTPFANILAHQIHYMHIKTHCITIPFKERNKFPWWHKAHFITIPTNQSLSSSMHSLITANTELRLIIHHKFPSFYANKEGVLNFLFLKNLPTHTLIKKINCINIFRFASFTGNICIVSKSGCQFPAPFLKLVRGAPLQILTQLLGTYTHTTGREGNHVVVDSAMQITLNVLIICGNQLHGHIVQYVANTSVILAPFLAF